MVKIGSFRLGGYDHKVKLVNSYILECSDPKTTSDTDSFVPGSDSKSFFKPISNLFVRLMKLKNGKLLTISKTEFEKDKENKFDLAKSCLSE
jgi:hypothetical protein